MKTKRKREKVLKLKKINEKIERQGEKKEKKRK